MSRNKKILLAAGAAIGSLLVALLALPFLFVDQIEARVRAEIERAAQVRVSWSDIGLTMFGDFPHPRLSMNGLAVVGTGRFDGDTLATVADFHLALDGGSVIAALRGRAPLVVRSVRLESPALQLRVDEEGIPSWDVLPRREGATDSQGRNMAISLRSLEVTDGRLVLDDARSEVFLSVLGLTHSLRGDFSRESLAATTSTHSDAVTLRFAGVPYLSGVAMDFRAGFDVDMASRRARLTDNELRINDLALRVDGEVGRDGPNTTMDLTFEAPNTAFAQALSLLPAVYAQDFASIQAGGTFSMTGRVEGAWGEGAFPAFDIDIDVADGRFSHPGAPRGAQAISAALDISNAGGDIDSTVVNLSAFHVEFEGQPIDASVVLRTPVSDPDARVRVQGTVDLASVARTMKLADADEWAGVIVADANVSARRSDLDSARYERVMAEGTVSARDVTLRSEALRQPVDVREASIHLTPRTAELRSLDARLGSSDLQATGRLDNLLGFVLGQDVLSGAANVTSGRFDLDEWRSDDEVAAIAVPAVFDLTLDGSIDQLLFNGLEMNNAGGRAIVREQRMTLEGFTLETLGGRVGMDGFYETLDVTRPTFALDLVLDSLDVAGTAAAINTVRVFAPVARYTRGTFSTALALSGALGQDMAPALDVLEGDGSLSTSRLAIENLPLLDRLSETLSLERLSNPTVDAVRSSIRIQGGRLVVEPFQVGVAGLAMSVSGSNGVDQSIDYTLGLAVPRTGFADAALTSLASRAGPLGAALAATDPVRVQALVTGSVTSPSLAVSLSETAVSTRDAATQAAGNAVSERVDEAQQRLDASREEARQRAAARADTVVAEARRRAETVRAEAAAAAATVRAEGNRAAEEVLTRATNPLARAAAQPVAERIRREAEERAAAIEQEADELATSVVTQAEERAARIRSGEGGGS